MADTTANFNNISGYFTRTGVIVPDTTAVRSEIESFISEEIGAPLDFSSDTPLGVIVDALAIGVSGVIGICAQNANQFNLNQSTGVFLDSLGAIFGLSRIQAERTRVGVKLTGKAGSTIPAGSMARTITGGDLFFAEDDIVLNSDGESSEGACFVSSEYGAVPCDIGELTIMDTVINDWWSITNQTAGQLGRLVEGDEDFRARIKAKKSIGEGYVSSVYTSIMGTAGVKNCVVYENADSNPKVTNGILIDGHSIYVCVVGGEENEDGIARAIFTSKAAGCGITHRDQGSQQIVDKTVTDGGYTYHVYFYRPSYVSPSISVSVRSEGYAGTDVVSDVKNVVTSYVDSLDIGEDVTSFGIGIAIQTAIPSVRVVTATVGGVSSYSVAGYQKAIGVAENISVESVS